LKAEFAVTGAVSERRSRRLATATGRLLPHLRDDDADGSNVERALRGAEQAERDRRQPVKASGGDARRLRGVPVIGSGLDGAIRGTQPGRLPG
jgi:hypothetical protein